MTWTPGKSGRRRCCECRGWYQPKRSATKTQKTCSRKCRLRRRARQERKRRAEELVNARADERDRQRRHRARKAEKQGRDRPVSLTGLAAQVVDTVEQIVEEVGQAQRLSLTGLSRRVRRIALKAQRKTERNGENVGQDSPVSLTGHPA